MANARGCVVVGGGLAAATLVQTLREGGFTEPLTLIGEERDRPYERPALSKDYLQGKTAAGDLYVHPENWYPAHQVQTRFADTVTEIDRRTCSVRLRSGETVGYSQLVLATGASPRTLSLPGVDLAGVHTLRRIGDADVLRTALTSGRRLVIIGAGWIGLEVAASARSAGCEVTVLEAAAVPLSRVLGERLGRYFTELHRQHGVDLRTDTQVTAVLGRGGQVIGVQTDRDVIPADLVLIAVGVTPNTSLADAIGLRIDNGVVVDEQLRTSDPAILAIGDVANAYHWGWDSRYGWSTGTTPSGTGSSPVGPSSPKATATTGSPTSTPTSTTSAWSTSVTLNPRTTLSSAATCRTGPSSPSGSANSGSPPP